MLSNEEFLMERVSPEPTTGCWLWTGRYFRRNAYGRARRDERAHRFSFETLVSPIPAGLSVLHRCDNPACVNPAHLFLGTQADNMRDMARKGRGLIRSVLTPAQIQQARALAASGVLHREIAAQLGVDRTCISRRLKVTS